VADGGRYLIDQNGAPFLIAGESPQALMVNLSEDDAERFFANRQSHGFNAVWINLLCRAGTGGRADGSTYDGLLPFEKPDDFSAPNETYFARCDRMIRLAGKLDVPDRVLHAFTDGRDTLPESGAGYLATVQEWMQSAGTGRIGSVIGRYYAMDRDRRWERIQRAYDLLVHGRASERAASGEEAARAAYDRDQTDEFIEPVLVGEEARIRPDDAVVAFNFRPDRMRELTRALAEPGFDEIDRDGAPVVERYVTMTEYEEGWPYPAAFAPERPETTLAAVLADAGVRQLHVAETEKYPHVTYFFGGGDEQPQPGERRDLVPSPRDVPTYDHKPEMSAREAAAAFVSAWECDAPGFGIINFANADMVGHTGSLEATVQAVHTVDACVGRVVAAAHKKGAAVVITADHGNAEQMIDYATGGPFTSHTIDFPVPIVVAAGDNTDLSGCRVRDGGVLADVAPTVLHLMGLEQPPEMEGRNLLLC